MKENKMNDNVFPLHKIDVLSSSSIVITNELRTNNYTKANANELNRVVVISALVILIVITLGSILNRALDITFNNQNIMLCESSKKSGNVEYLNKCKCYFESKDITCLEGGE